jgi:DNA processing protein
MPITPFSYQDFYTSLTTAERKSAPKDLFVEGNPSLLLRGLKVAVVGSRKPSDQGIRDAQCLARTLVQHGAIVVCGLAEGIDTAAHQTAIENGGQTIAVLGTPLDIAYPAKNKSLLDEIKLHHLAVSQFPTGSPVTPKNFPMRNKTMALLSDATIIVEATEESGTRHQGWEALRLGRVIFILKPMIDNKELSWPSEMMKYGAQELTCELLPSFLEGVPNVTSRSDYASFY